MPGELRRYVVGIEGENVWLREQGRRTHSRRFGFVTTRVITASSEEEACALAIRSAREELQGQINNVPTDPPTVAVDPERIWSFDLDVEVNAPTRGFTFFPQT